jgi:hypothetical protein
MWEIIIVALLVAWFIPAYSYSNIRALYLSIVRIPQNLQHNDLSSDYQTR